MNAIHSSSPVYEYRVIRQFVAMGLVWGLSGTLLGVWLAASLRWPSLDPGLEYLSFGRVVPAHALMMSYGFAVNLLFAIAYFVVQRTAQGRLRNGFYSLLSFWGLQAVVVLGVAASLGGLGQGAVVPDLPWPLDLLLVAVWLAWVRQMFATLGKRSRAPVYIAVWFFIAFGVVVAAVQLLTSLAVPLTATGINSYPLFGGISDALLQQWQLHTLTACLLMGTFTGAFYYVLPRQLGGPLHSQALATANFWALLLTAVWVGGPYLHWSALPDWVGGVGSGFSVMLVVATLAGPLNGYLTLKDRTGSVRGAAAKDPIIGFLVLAMLLLLVFTVEGGVFSLREFSAWKLDMGWSGIQIHSLGLGWTSMVAIASIYHLVPRVWGVQIARPAWITVHLWVAVLGIAVYLAGHWSGGVAQASALGDWDDYGNLVYGFVETLTLYPSMNVLRVIGGVIFGLGLIMMAANLLFTSAEAGRQQRELDRILEDRMSRAKASVANSGIRGGVAS